MDELDPHWDISGSPELIQNPGYPGLENRFQCCSVGSSSHCLPTPPWTDGSRLWRSTITIQYPEQSSKIVLPRRGLELNRLSNFPRPTQLAGGDFRCYSMMIQSKHRTWLRKERIDPNTTLRCPQEGSVRVNCFLVSSRWVVFLFEFKFIKYDSMNTISIFFL